MIIIFHKKFEKQIVKIPKSIQNQFYKKIELFQVNPFDEILNNHELKGKLKGYRSINITGDVRAIYKQINGKIIHFVKINTHSELY